MNPDVPTTPGAQTTVLRYGPWTVPAATEANNGEGMIKNNLAFGAKRPCGDCFITGIRPTLKFPDGRVANADAGLWLHHIVLSTLGRPDPVCSGTNLGLLGERFFASGNERTRMLLPAGVGLKVGALDSWVLVYDLMNTSPTPEPVVLEVTYQWVPASTPGMRAVKPVWLDVGPCGQPNLRASTGAYRYQNHWTVNVPGQVIGAGGHLHDGGTELIVRDETAGREICASKAGYGGPGFEVAAGTGHNHGGGGGGPTLHLSSMSQCVSRSVDGPLAVLTTGNQISITADYDSNAHPHGNHPVMGIALLYVLP